MIHSYTEATDYFLFQKEFYSAGLGKHLQNCWRKHITGKKQTLQSQSKSLVQYARWP